VKHSARRRSQRWASGIALLVCALLAAPQADASAGWVDAELTTPAAAPQASMRAATAVVLGQTTYDNLFTCSSAVMPLGVVLHTSGGGASYAAPAPGVITSWSTVGGSVAGSSRLLLFGPGTVVDHKTLVAKSPYVPVPSGIGVVHTAPVRIPVQTGEELGLGTSISGQACALNAGVAGDAASIKRFDADTSTDFAGTPGGSAVRPNVSAVLEPDVDGDG
jgi:hypothetical protein